MQTYSPEALGSVVATLRTAPNVKLTQRQLGVAAGYADGPGAGVTMNRFEKGSFALNRDQLTKVAAALGVTVADLEARAVEETLRRTEAGERSYDERLAAVVEAKEQRQRLGDDLQALEGARQQAERLFLLAFRDMAAERISAVALGTEDLLNAHVESSDDAESAAAFQIDYTRFGVSAALASGATGEAEGSYLALAEAVALRAAPLGAQVAGNSTALRGFLAAAGVGRSARVLGPAGGASLLGAVALGAVAVTMAERQARANRTRRQQESSSKLIVAEAEIAETQPNVDSLVDVVARAKGLFEYIAVHASHALTRWGNTIGDGPLQWADLAETERQRYRDFETVAAAQLSVATIDLERLARSRGDELVEVIALADQILLQADEQVRSRV